ncbi:MAG: tRNA 2-selenouridine(34) synthase MnmH [Gammaproteobacteria bacterium]|nr:tRNA 2-selenouridine(34) synthase MnmH [Gammaproteobacteria bacterium]
MQRDNTDNFRALFLNDTPLMDVRAPVEFIHGAFPHTINVPILDDEQRHLVGTKYKEAGQDEAIKLGVELITPEIREQRLKQWTAFCEQNTEGFLYCFRGGLRSRTTQQWLKESGVSYPLIKGGYKALRRFLIDELEESIQQVPFIRVAGRTGSGKTHVLLKMQHYLDFEGIAQHKGSAFGRNVTDTQPSIINWENQISIEMLKHNENHSSRVLFVEDEGRMIGRCVMPDNLHQKMVHSPSIMLLESDEKRIDNITQDYVEDPWPLYQQQYADEAEEYYSAFMLSSLERIQKRLGLELYKEVKVIFENGLNQLFNQQNSQGFRDAFEILLTKYYDPMYDYQMNKRQGDVLFEGNEAEIIAWSNER